jgi:BirA family transcriptional regulator, biotin operon repressor / biotin---[acetyl-CoA-carboxylase] ligase
VAKIMEIIDIHLDTIDSTNSYAKLHVKEFHADQIVCIDAEEQTAGRGRQNRPWYSPRSQNIYATFVFRLPLHTLHLISLGQVMTLSLAMVLLKEGLHPMVKWPNDVHIDGKKIAGVLCETEFHATHIDIFLGIGVNVNMDAKQLTHIDQPATSLFIETGHNWDRHLLLKKLQKQFAADLQKFKKEGFTPFHSQFENLLAYKGQTIRCFDGKKEWVGICHSVTNDGQLNLYLPNKEIHTILSGNIKPGK